MNTTYDNTLECAFNSSDIHSLISKHWPHVLTLLTNHWDATTKFLDMRAHLEKYPFNVPKIRSEYWNRQRGIHYIDQCLPESLPSQIKTEIVDHLLRNYAGSSRMIDTMPKGTPYILFGRVSSCCTVREQQWLWSCGYEMGFNKHANEYISIDGVLHLTTLCCNKKNLKHLETHAGMNYEDTSNFRQNLPVAQSASIPNRSSMAHKGNTSSMHCVTNNIGEDATSSIAGTLYNENSTNFKKLESEVNNFQKMQRSYAVTFLWLIRKQDHKVAEAESCNLKYIFDYITQLKINIKQYIINKYVVILYEWPLSDYVFRSLHEIGIRFNSRRSSNEKLIGQVIMKDFLVQELIDFVQGQNN